jgi:stage II sporulation SpoE-like protein
MPRGRASRSTHFFELVPPRAALVFFAAIFFVFAPVNFLLTSSFEGSWPLGPSLVLALLSGASAVCWAATFTVSRRFAFGIVPFMLGVMLLSGPLALPVLGVRPLPPSAVGFAVVGSIVLGYVLFIVFINGQGRTTLRLLTEMALAQRIHASLVPALLRSDERLEVDGASFASTEMGGDLVDMVDHGSTTDLVLADVSGHGVKAGVVMGMVKSAIRMGLREDRDLPHLARDLNDVLDQTTSPEMYATLVLLRIDHDERRLECLLAGHSQVLHHRRGENAASRVGEGGFPVGLLGESTYSSVSLGLAPGDLIATWTDGLDETVNGADQELGREAIESAIVARAERPLAEIRSAVFDLARAHGPQRDDRSLLLVRVR